MATAVTERGQRTRERLIEGAAELIRDQGVEKTSIDQILARTDTSKSQLYHYFADKDELVRAVIAYRTRDVLRQSAEALDAVDSWSALRRWFELIVAAQEADACRHGCPIGSIANELADTDPRARADLAGSFEAWKAEIEKALERLRANGRLRPRADTHALAEATLAAIQGGLLLSKTLRDPAPLRGSLDAAFAYLRSFAG